MVLSRFYWLAGCMGASLLTLRGSVVITSWVGLPDVVSAVVGVLFAVSMGYGFIRRTRPVEVAT